MIEDEEPKRNQTSTVPPPEGEDDLYNASTKIGQASDELLALVRATHGDIARLAPGTDGEEEQTKVAPMPIPLPVDSAGAKALSPASAPAPAAEAKAAAREVTSRRRSPHAVKAPLRTTNTGMPPVASIALLFGAAAALLAVLVR
jgi:hypothetical protein